MRHFICMLFAFGCFASPSRGDVTGIALSRTTGTEGTANSLTTFNITFMTSNGGASFGLNKIILYNADATADTVDFSFNSDFSNASSIAATNSGGLSTFNFVGATFNQTLAANSEYTLYVKALVTGKYGTSDGLISAGAAPLAFSGTQTADHTTYYTKFELYATVPEPCTLVLTGAALAAGAVGVWRKRRRIPLISNSKTKRRKSPDDFPCASSP